MHYTIQLCSECTDMAAVWIVILSCFGMPFWLCLGARKFCFIHTDYTITAHLQTSVDWK